MHIRAVKTKKHNQKGYYSKHVLVESYRNVDGKPRSRVIMQCGQVPFFDDILKRHALAWSLEQRLAGQSSFVNQDPEIEAEASRIMAQHMLRQGKLSERDERKDQQEIVSVDVNSVGTTKHRTLGGELVGVHAWDQLGLDGILSSVGMKKKQRALAKAVVIGKLVDPGNDLYGWRGFNSRSAMGELLDVNLIGAGKDRFYEIADQLLLHKEAIEKALYRKEQEIVGQEHQVFLYDLTNTYFEGECAGNALAKRGRSKEKRSDCPLVTLALMVDSHGFPVMSQIYEGNQSEPKTLSQVLKRLESDMPLFAKGQTTLVMDRGIATAGNVKLVQECGYAYTIITRRNAAKEYEKDFEDLDSFSVMKEGEEQDRVFVKKIMREEQVQVLCMSEQRKHKERSMDRLAQERFDTDMERLAMSVAKGSIVRAEKVGERVGRIKQKYASIAQHYAIHMEMEQGDQKDSKNTKEPKDQRVYRLWWEALPSRESRKTLTGCYVIESSQNDLDAKAIWKQYMTILRVEKAFESLKSHLGMRPIYHHGAHRTRGHLFIVVLAYHLLRMIEYQMAQQGDQMIH